MPRGKATKIRYTPGQRVKPSKTVTSREGFLRRYSAVHDRLSMVLNARIRRLEGKLANPHLTEKDRERIKKRLDEAWKQKKNLEKKHRQRFRPRAEQESYPKRHLKFRAFLSDPYFREQVSIQAKKHRHSSIGYLDIDYLHSINDLIEHRGGNVVIEALGEALEKVVGKKGGFAGKHGGEEILVWAPVEHEKMAELLRKTAEQFHNNVIKGLLRSTIRPHTLEEIERMRKESEITIEDANRMKMLLENYPDIGRFSAGIVPLSGNEIRKDFEGAYGKALNEADSLAYKAKRKGRNKSALVEKGNVVIRELIA